MMRVYMFSVGALVLAGCATNPLVETTAPEAVAPVEVSVDTGTRPQARPDEVPVVAAAEPAPVINAPDRPVQDGKLGTTLATLGDVTNPGLWIETPLARASGPGRVTTAGGASVDVTLIPIEGEATAGSRLSLSAMQGLGLSLTDIADVTVTAL